MLGQHSGVRVLQKDSVLLHLILSPILKKVIDQAINIDIWLHIVMNDLVWHSHCIVLGTLPGLNVDPVGL